MFKENNFAFAIFITCMTLSCLFITASQASERYTGPGFKIQRNDTATLATGCFWCTEAVFQELDGVISVVSGYSGGITPNPSYESVSSGLTGHAECCQVIFNPDKISFADLLEVFWKVHDPTTLNRQGNDIGPQYRSAIFYHTEIQQQVAKKYKKLLSESGAYTDPVVTEISRYKGFYKAENYHQDYFRLHGNEPYCQYVIQPKLDKFRQVFKEKIKN